jgi:hypothetical protein
LAPNKQHTTSLKLRVVAGVEGAEEGAEKEAKAEVEDVVMVKAGEDLSPRQQLRTVITLLRSGPVFLMLRERRFIKRELISTK